MSSYGGQASPDADRNGVSPDAPRLYAWVMARGAGTPQVRPRCWVCDREGLSDEHVIAKSLTELFGDVKSITGVDFASDQSRPPKVKTSKRFALVARFVCQDCNNGWMNDLDTGLRPVLGGLVAGAPMTLLPEAQHRLATWATKVMFGMVAARPPQDQLVPRDLYRALGELKAPPVGTEVWLGSHPSDYHVQFVGFRVTLLDLDGAQGFVLALTFGHAVFALLHHGRRDRQFRLILQSKALLSEIYPPQPKCQWPPVARVKDGRLEQLEYVLARPHNAFRRVGSGA